MATLGLLGHADANGQCHADLNGNHMVDNHELLILLADYGQRCEDAGWHDPVISKTHYNPSTQQASDSGHEFLELTNSHQFDLHVSGWLGTPHNNALQTSWVASSALGGSPGMPNSTWADWRSGQLQSPTVDGNHQGIARQQRNICPI